MFVGFSIGPVVIPNNQISANSTLYILCAMPSIPQVQDSPSHLMVVGMAMLAMILLSKHATKFQGGTRKVGIAQTHIKRDIGIVRVHVQTQVFSRLITDEEGMVIVELLAVFRKESTGHWPEVLLLKGGNHGSHANVIDNNAIIVHF
jgi:hypothetical protein